MLSSLEINEKDIEKLLLPYISTTAIAPPSLFRQLAQYLQLLLKWNARTNLTAIRDPEEIVLRHFGESLFAAQHLGKCETVLDFGSGAGFPGLPIQLFHPDLRVTLAESQNKKSAFLREAIRTLGLKTEVWAGRVEAMPTAQRFDVVTLRAVDNMEAAIQAASLRVGRRMMLLTTVRQQPPKLDGFTNLPTVSFPATNEQQLLLMDRDSR